MGRDEGMSKKLSEIEEKKQGYLARRVEASDKERVDANTVVSDAAVREGGEPSDSSNSVNTIISPLTAVPPPVVCLRAAAGGRCATTAGSEVTSESFMCQWTECAQDKRSWAEVLEEEQGAWGGLWQCSFGRY